jgi:valyl-tRNA synthetase
VTPWPESKEIGEKNYRMNLLMDMIAQRRALRVQVTDKPHEKITLSLQSNIDIHTLVKDHEELVISILNVEQIVYASEVDAIDPEFTTAVLMDITL